MDGIAGAQSAIQEEEREEYQVLYIVDQRDDTGFLRCFLPNYLGRFQRWLRCERVFCTSSALSGARVRPNYHRLRILPALIGALSLAPKQSAVGRQLPRHSDATRFRLVSWRWRRLGHHIHCVNRSHTRDCLAETRSQRFDVSICDRRL